MTVKASQIKFLFIPKDSIRKAKCGCIETKINIMGVEKWVRDLDGFCKKCLIEFRKEIKKQAKIQYELARDEGKSKSKSKKKRSIKKNG